MLIQAIFSSKVLCLQEVQEDHYGTEIRPSLESLGTNVTFILARFTNELLKHSLLTKVCGIFELKIIILKNSLIPILRVQEKIEVFQMGTFVLIHILIQMERCARISS